jgi:phage terminase large subunit-like protein
MTSSMSSPNVALPESQAPRICHIPASAVNFELGREAVELAAMAGLHLDPWQQFVIVNGMAQNARGKYAAFEVGFNVARQNGKGGILECRELTGLYLLNEPMQIHSAHQFDTSLEAFRGC